MYKNKDKMSIDLVDALQNAESVCAIGGEDMNIIHLFLGIINNGFISKKIIGNIGNSGYYKILNGISSELRGGLDIPSMPASKLINSVIEKNNNKTANSIDVLVGILEMDDDILNKWVGGIGFDFIDKGILESLENEVVADEGTFSEEKNDGEPGLLDRWCTNLNKISDERKFDDVICRDDEIERIENILCRRKKNNPVLVGDPGVGKTAIIEGLVKKIKLGQVNEDLIGKTIYATTAGELTSGTRFRGDLEEKIEGIISELEEDNNKILFIDEIHTVMKKSSDVADLLKPALSGKKINCIGATTHEEWRRYFSKDGAMSRRMSVVEIKEPSVEDTIKIITQTKINMEKFHGVKVSNLMASMSVKLADKWIQDNQFPDKAIDVIDEACVLTRKRGSLSVNKSDIEISIRNLTKGKAGGSGIRVKNLTSIQNRIKRRVKGQDHCIDEVCDFIRVAESGLGYINKPKGIFMFRGPSGVGKTEVSKAISEELKINLIKVDMGEYSESHSISKIIGSPPGYVGYEEGGKITEQIHKNPHSILVLDEIEKAHPSVLNVLLGVFDDGYMTDSAGRKIDFTNTYVIMTSNVATKEDGRGEFGFTGSSNDLVKNELIRVFSSEFVNRINYIAVFKALNEKTMNSIVSEALKQLSLIMKEKNVQVNFSSGCRREILKTAILEKMGARPVERIVHNKIKPILSRALIKKPEKDIVIIYNNGSFKIK